MKMFCNCTPVCNSILLLRLQSRIWRLEQVWRSLYSQSHTTKRICARPHGFSCIDIFLVHWGSMKSVIAEIVFIMLEVSRLLTSLYPLPSSVLRPPYGILSFKIKLDLRLANQGRGRGSFTSSQKPSIRNLKPALVLLISIKFTS